jgi:hypothetical protein
MNWGPGTLNQHSIGMPWEEILYFLYIDRTDLDIPTWLRQEYKLVRGHVRPKQFLMSDLQGQVIASVNMFLQLGDN